VCFTRDLLQNTATPDRTKRGWATCVVGCPPPPIRPVRRVEAHPGLQTQVGLVQSRPLVVEELSADPVQLQAFIMTLSHSRIWAMVWSAREDLLACLSCHTWAFIWLGAGGCDWRQGGSKRDQHAVRGRGRPDRLDASDEGLWFARATPTALSQHAATHRRRARVPDPRSSRCPPSVPNCQLWLRAIQHDHHLEQKHHRVADHVGYKAYIEEVSAARIYGGIHYRTSALVGQDMGRRIAELVLRECMRPSQSH
jgi:hypothetical protein